MARLLQDRARVVCLLPAIAAGAIPGAPTTHTHGPPPAAGQPVSGLEQRPAGSWGKAGMAVRRFLTGTIAALVLLVSQAGAGGLGVSSATAQVRPADGRIVAPWIVDVIEHGEANRVAGDSTIRLEVERFQDQVARLDPPTAILTDWSIGRYYIRPSTARAALDWAFAAGTAAAYGYARRPSDIELVRHILDPARDGALVQVILAQLRDDHPLLRALNWEQIEASDQAVAKLFSGWLGAGGAWDAWRADLTPGPLARQYLRCAADGSRCAVVQAHRPSRER